LNKVGENKNISLKQIGEKEQTLASDEIDADTNEVYLKLVSQGIGYDFYYSIDGEKSWKLLCKDVAPFQLSLYYNGWWIYRYYNWIIRYLQIIIFFI